MMRGQEREIHVEHLLGKRVRDARGKAIGRIQELCVDMVDGLPAVVEIHVGPGALFERVGAFVHQLPFFSLIPWTPTLRRIRWDEIDLSDEWHPRLRDR
jgi:sporulation protein YlmC with PRC-barrel domain